MVVETRRSDWKPHKSTKQITINNDRLYEELRENFLEPFQLLLSLCSVAVTYIPSDYGNCQHREKLTNHHIILERLTS